MESANVSGKSCLYESALRKSIHRYSVCASNQPTEMKPAGTSDFFSSFVSGAPICTLYEKSKRSEERAHHAGVRHPAWASVEHRARAGDSHHRKGHHTGHSAHLLLLLLCAAQHRCQAKSDQRTCGGGRLLPFFDSSGSTT